MIPAIRAIRAGACACGAISQSENIAQIVTAAASIAIDDRA